MKKYTTIFIIFLMAMSVFSQEGLKIGIYGGLPIGKDSEPYTLNLQGNLDYLFHVTKEIHIGITTGYSRYLGDKTDGAEIEDLAFLPLGGTAQFHVDDKIKIGGDIGYALVLQPDNLNGGFYYAPKIQYMLSENTDVVLAYRGISIDGGSLSAITLGLEFGFF